MRLATALLASGAVLGSSSFLSPAHAQQARPSLVGERVRVTGDFRTVAGRVVEIGRDSLVIAPSSTRLTAVALAQVERLELSAGERRNILKGAGIGALAGLGTALALAGVVDQWGFTAPSESLDGSGYAIAGALGTGVGALVGLGIGAMVKSERWTEVPRERWSLSVGAGDGVVLGFRFTP